MSNRQAKKRYRRALVLVVDFLPDDIAAQVAEFLYPDGSQRAELDRLNNLVNERKAKVND